MNSYIVDVSVAVKWFVLETLQMPALELSDKHLIAPDFLRIEFANVMWKKVRRGDMDQPEADEAMSGLESAGVEWRDAATFIRPALKLAVACNRAVYDCLYLALAIDLDQQLVSADERFINAIKATRWRDHVIWLGALGGAN